MMCPKCSRFLNSKVMQELVLPSPTATPEEVKAHGRKFKHVRFDECDYCGYSGRADLPEDYVKPKKEKPDFVLVESSKTGSITYDVPRTIVQTD